MTPASLPKRTSRPTVNPTRGAIASPKLSSPDALAATFTPEFERVNVSQLAPASRRRVWPMLLAGSVVVAAGGVAAFLMLGSGGTSTSAERPVPAAAPSAAPIVNTAPVAPPVVDKAPAQAPPADVVTPTAPVTPSADDIAQQAEPTKRPKPPKARTGSGATTTTQTGSAAPTRKDPGDAPSTKGDIIHLGSDTFGKDP
jgi:hypothetical protein